MTRDFSLQHFDNNTKNTETENSQLMYISKKELYILYTVKYNISSLMLSKSKTWCVEFRQAQVLCTLLNSVSNSN